MMECSCAQVIELGHMNIGTWSEISITKSLCDKGDWVPSIHNHNLDRLHQQCHQGCRCLPKSQAKKSYNKPLTNLERSVFNPLSPVPPVTSHDEPWPSFHFWCHHFWPKLSSSILNFCRRKRSFQWCPDQSNRPNGAEDMHKNAQKVEWKTQGKFLATTPGCSMIKVARLDDVFVEDFNRKQAQ